MKIPRETVIKVNQEMIIRKGKPRYFSPIEKYADSLVYGTSDSFEPKEIKEEFNNLDVFDKKRLILFAEFRKNIKEKLSCPDKLKQAYKDARDKVLGKK